MAKSSAKKVVKKTAKAAPSKAKVPKDPIKKSRRC